MAEQDTGASEAAHGGDDHTRRDFLYIAAGAFAAFGAGAVAWPLIDTLNPAADTLAASTVDVDLSPIQEGQRVTVKYRGSPVFIDRRTKEQIAEARKVPTADLPDPQSDEARVFKDKDQWLVVIGVCTHLGCIPLGQEPGSKRGEFNGWFCPCHGSHYDTSGRIRKGPAPTNLPLPDYRFLSDTQIRLGEKPKDGPAPAAMS